MGSVRIVDRPESAGLTSGDFLLTEVLESGLYLSKKIKFGVISGQLIPPIVDGLAGTYFLWAATGSGLSPNSRYTFVNGVLSSIS